jgi:2-dehydro-3-deoxygluconokinase
MGLFYVELAAPPRPSRIIYDRADSTATKMTELDFPWDALANAELMHVSGITPAISSSCRQLTTEVINRAAESEVKVSIDVNFRSKLWAPGRAREWFESVSGSIDLLIINSEDARDVFGIKGEGARIAEQLQEEMAAATVVLSLGRDGAIWKAEGPPVHVPARKTMVIDRIGAGDAFAAGVIAGYIDDDLEGGVEMGVVMASLILGLKGDFLTTSLGEVRSQVESSGRSIDR